MANITQESAGTKGFNLQINIPDPLKRELNTVAAELGCYPRDVAIDCIQNHLPVKRQEAKKLREAETTKKNGLRSMPKRRGL